MNQPADGRPERGTGTPSTPAPRATSQAAGDTFFTTPPALSLPKGGGAIRGIGEKFAANPVTGSSTFSIPLPASPGRGGFGPQLALSYDSGSGNGPFGFGWSLALPAITRKTDKGLPQYVDAEDSDVFLLSGAEDLVPVFKKKANGDWDLNPDGSHTIDEVTRDAYRVRRYRPRIEGLFARIERWTDSNGDVHWRSISSDNVLSIYGKDGTSRIFDPADPSRIFSWLICETRDDKGNAIGYDYKEEDGLDPDLTQAHEQQRGAAGSGARKANRYIHRIRYGNVPTLLDANTLRRPLVLTEQLIGSTRWMFELEFDYGELDPDKPSVVGPWVRRGDPFSSYRAGFEVRTYRLCRRVLMFHDFPEFKIPPPDLDDPSVGPRRLVRSLDLSYRTTPQDVASSDPGYSFLQSAIQWSYQWDAGKWHRRALPPVKFTYSEATIDQQVRDVDAQSLENLPIGLGAGYQWIDLDGEGLSGILTEQAGAWYYKPNLGDEPSGPRFGPMQPVASRPSLAALNSGRQQLMDVQGNGALDLVDFHPPLAGFQERDEQQGWKQFIPFASLPNIDWDDENLRFVDLTGDGHADALITEHEIFTWYPSRAEEGFGAAERTATPIDERDGPRIVFADGAQAIYLADMSGDGLSDIVRIRNGQVCYWPNLGYGRFGTQVVMDRSPWFDHPDLFEQRRIRLADIDGSGTTDLFYLGRDGARLWFNRSGNSWSEPRQLPFPVATSNVGQIQVADLLGNGTACLVWSSDLPGDARRPLRYVDLMGGRKPHLMIEMRNNLGAVTTVDYAASTKFYLQDKAAGTPWVTRLPFPVHCVEKITVNDLRRKTFFANTYSYHHGYFDGIEREFRGFGRVEQLDTQRFDEFAGANLGSAFVAADHKLYQPPVKTITWFHTGIATDRSRILGLYEREYFPSRYAARLAGTGFAERELPQPNIEVTGTELEADEWREAMRSCKGMALRQEVVELEVKALQDRGEHKPVRLFSAAQHNCHIRRVQPRGANQHSVFLVTESEAVTYHYELTLGGAAALAPDPRVAHTLNLRFDDYGRAMQSVAAVYPRHDEYADAPSHPAPLTTEQIELIRAVQREPHLAYTETRFTDELPAADIDTHRLPAPCEACTYELTGVDVPAGARYFSIGVLRDYQLNKTLNPQAPKTVVSRGYHQQPLNKTPHKRLVEHAATLYFNDDLSGPLPIGTPGRLGLTYENYKLALTASLLDEVFKSTAPQDAFNAEARTALDAPAVPAGFFVSGYQTDARIFRPGEDPVVTAWWTRSGIAEFEPDAALHFYLPERYIDPFGNQTRLAYDKDDDLFVQSSTDALGNTTTVEAFDHRILAPAQLRDANNNVSEAAFDIRGLPVATALMGKVTNDVPETHDTVKAFSFDELNPSPTDVAQFFEATPLNETQARTWRDTALTWLGTATARVVYHFGESYTAGTPSWEVSAAGACSIVREKHERDLANTPANNIPLQMAFEYSDGAGQAFVKKVQAEPDPALVNGPVRWIANGKTIVNNKGKPVLQYEPYFSKSDHRFEEPVAEGVTAVMFYDAPGRLVRTEFPDGTLARVEFSPWFSRSFDQSDTVKESHWYRVRLTKTERDPNASPATATEETEAEGASPEDKRAARLAALHANTPAEVHFDSLGREVIAIAHNRMPDETTALATDTTVADWGWKEERYLTFTKLDAEGKPLWICDARGNLVMQYITPPKSDHTPLYDKPTPDYKPAYNMPAKAVPCYDIAGNLLFQHSMDAGDRRMLMDATSKPMLAWDYYERDPTTTPLKEHRRFETRYDTLHRPIEQWLRINTNPPALIEAFKYIDTQSFTTAAGVDQVALDDARKLNLIGQATHHYDPSGLATVERVDYKGAAKEITRTLVDDVEAAVVDWNVADRRTLLEDETFTQITEHDAIGRMSRHYNWHRGIDSRVGVYEPRYNERGALASEDLVVRTTKTATGYDAAVGTRTTAIQEMRYDAKGQKTRLRLGNRTVTHYTYDSDTFRLTGLYTRRDTRFSEDCGGKPPPPRTAAPDTDAPPRSCGVQNLHYTYDPVGNITHIRDDVQQTIYFKNVAVEPSSDYIYDALYRLIEGTGRENAAAIGAPPHPEGPWSPGSVPSPDATRRYIQRYRYDGVGNIGQMQHIAPHFDDQSGSWTRYYEVAKDSNRLLRTWQGDSDWKSNKATDKTSYRHDAHGSMLNLANTTPGLDIRWDWRDMIRALDLLGGGWAHYNYCIDKQRTRKYLKRNGNGREDLIYLDGYELYRRYQSTNPTPVEEIESLHLFEGDQRVLLVDDVIAESPSTSPRPDGLTVTARTLFRYQYSNHLGSVAVELDEDGLVISYEEFHPYGTSAYRLMNSEAKAHAKRYRYTGMERDEESGCGSHGARYYAQSLGRWIGCDPSGIKDGPNVYTYTQTNPIGRSDPTGRDTKLVVRSDNAAPSGREPKIPRSVLRMDPLEVTVSPDRPSPSAPPLVEANDSAEWSSFPTAKSARVWVEDGREFVILMKASSAFGRRDLAEKGVVHWFIKTPNNTFGLGQKGQKRHTDPETLSPIAVVTDQTDMEVTTSVDKSGKLRDQIDADFTETRIYGSSGFTAKVDQQANYGAEKGIYGTPPTGTCQEFCVTTLREAGAESTPPTAADTHVAKVLKSFVDLAIEGRKQGGIEGTAKEYAGTVGLYGAVIGVEMARRVWSWF